MRLLVLALCVVLVLFLVGCATAPLSPPRELFPAHDLTAGSSQADIGRVYAQTRADCSYVLAGFEARSDAQKQAAAWTRLIGSLLGGVLLPIGVAASWGEAVIAGIGATAGWTNIAPDAFRREGLGAADILLAREQVRQEMRAAIGDYLGARTAGDKRAAIASIDRMAAACTTYQVASPQEGP